NPCLGHQGEWIPWVSPGCTRSRRQGLQQPGPALDQWTVEDWSSSPHEGLAVLAPDLVADCLGRRLKLPSRLLGRAISTNRLPHLTPERGRKGATSGHRRLRG